MTDTLREWRVKMGKRRAELRFAGKTKDEISAEMRKVRSFGKKKYEKNT